MKTCGEWMYRSTFSFNSTLDGGEWSASRPGRFTAGERALSTYWMNPRACLDDMMNLKFLNLPGLEPRPLGRPACSHLLYLLRYCGSLCCIREERFLNLPFTGKGGAKRRPVIGYSPANTCCSPANDDKPSRPMWPPGMLCRDVYYCHVYDWL
jgi:hypothetical protein